MYSCNHDDPLLSSCWTNSFKSQLERDFHHRVTKRTSHFVLNDKSKGSLGSKNCEVMGDDSSAHIYRYQPSLAREVPWQIHVTLLS